MFTEILKGTQKYVICFVCFILMVLALPVLLTQIPYCIVDFSNTGQIGDTIGGIMGPFVAIAAAILTFFAFWVQFKANTLQRSDIQIERFENNLFNYFQLLNNQISDSYIPNVGNNKQSYHFMFYEFKSICYYLQRLKISEYKKQDVIFKCAYTIFINGASLSDVKRITEDNMKADHSTYDKQEIKVINNFFYDFNRYKYLRKRNGTVQYLRDYKTLDIKLFDGHRLRLIPFYRSICIIIKYMYDEIFSNHYISSEQKKSKFEFYLNLLCSQLSEHQIGLLKIIYKYSCDKDHSYFVENKGVELFFKDYIQKYIIATTMDCDTWNFK